MAIEFVDNEISCNCQRDVPPARTGSGTLNNAKTDTPYAPASQLRIRGRYVGGSVRIVGVGKNIPAASALAEHLAGKVTADFIINKLNRHQHPFATHASCARSGYSRRCGEQIHDISPFVQPE